MMLFILIFRLSITLKIFQKKENYKLLSEDLVSFDQPIGVPDLTYGWAKLTSEYLGRIAYENYGIKSVVYRPFSGYGKDQDLSYPFPSICKRILNNKNSKQIQVWGTGDQMRDFIHISDCVLGVVKSMDKIDDGSVIIQKKILILIFLKCLKKKKV